MLTFKKVISVAFILALGLLYQNCTKFQVADTFSSEGPDLNPNPTLSGSQLYSNNCTACHSTLSNSTKINRTSSQITSAIYTIPQMSFLKDLLKADEIQAIAKVLERRADANPFTCAADRTPSADVLRRLSRDEYLNTVSDLFNGAIALNEIQTQVNQFPPDVGDDGNPFDRGVKTVTSGIFNAHVVIADRIGEILQANATKRSRILSEACFSTTPVTDACINSFIQRFGKLALRRPVDANEQTLFRTAFRIGGNTAESAKYLIRAILLHPSFLYHTEIKGTAVAGATGLYNLSSYELAARLSYLITGSLPDATLMAKADDQTILNANVLEEQTNRLLNSHKAKASFRRFYKKYLALESLPSPAYSPAFMGSVSATNLNEEAIEEILSFADYITLNNRPLSELLTSRVAFIKSNNIANLYGVSAGTGTDGRVTLPANRSGILSRIGFLLSGNNATNPIHRGFIVRSSLLCDEIGSPDPSVLPQGALEHPPLDPNMTTRERWTQKTSLPVCMTCHSQINPLGFALESFDSLGRVRTQESIFNNAGNITGTLPVDARVNPEIENTNEPSVDGGNQLALAMSDKQKFKACYVKKWHQFAMRKSIGPQDGCMAADVYEVLRTADGTPLEMIKAFVTHKNFSQRKQ